MTKAQRAEREQAITQLREWIKPGDTVYTILDHVSRSGMSRQIRVIVPYTRVRCEVCGHERTPENCTPELYIGEVCARAPECTGIYRTQIDHLHPNHAVAVALGLSRAKKGDGIIVGGCGMDMGFHLVYELSSVLYGGQSCACYGPRLDGVRKTPAEYHARPGGGRVSDGWTCGPDPACTDCSGTGYTRDSGYKCLGKGKCPSNYHTNHRDRIRCEGITVGENHQFCYRPDPFGRWEVPEDWPRSEPIELEEGVTVPGHLLACVRNREEHGEYVICPTCKGEGHLPNPEGPERFDLVHTDGYALRHRWL